MFFLTHWGLNTMATILQTIFLITFIVINFFHFYENFTKIIFWWCDWQGVGKKFSASVQSLKPNIFFNPSFISKFRLQHSALVAQDFQMTWWLVPNIHHEAIIWMNDYKASWCHVSSLDHTELDISREIYIEGDLYANWIINQISQHWLS